MRTVKEFRATTEKMEVILTEDALSTNDMKLRRTKLLRRDFIVAITKNLILENNNESKDDYADNIESSIDAFCDALIALFIDNVNLKFEEEFISGVIKLFTGLFEEKVRFVNEYRRQNGE